MNLKELIHKSNQLVHVEGHTLHELIEKNEFPSNVNDIIQLIKENESLIDTPVEEDYLSLKTALEKRREISLKATYAAISHLLLPEKFPLKSLDKFKSNLQSETKPQKESPMPESEELSQEDIEALLAGGLSDNKPKKSITINEDQLSNEDIDALLAGAKELEKSESPPIEPDTSKEKLTLPTNSIKEDEFSQDDIEALLAGNSKTKPATSEKEDFSIEELNNLIGADTLGEESDQISEDDIKSLLEAQDEQDQTDPLAKALNIPEGQISLPRKSSGNTEKIQGKAPEPSKTKIEEFPDKTNIPQNIFPSEKSIEELFSEKDLISDSPPLMLDDEINLDKKESNLEAKSNNKDDQKKSMENLDDKRKDGEVRERILEDVFALYINKDGKPVLHAKCPTREEIKKAYLQAMQNYPQNSLFIEKISRKEVIILKETKEIINLKINISFE